VPSGGTTHILRKILEKVWKIRITDN
jgi:hypothetical protein